MWVSEKKKNFLIFHFQFSVLSVSEFLKKNVNISLCKLNSGSRKQPVPQLVSAREHN
jgi:hypothetical protein